MFQDTGYRGICYECPLGELLPGSVAMLLFEIPVKTEREIVDGTTYESRGPESPIPF